ncbi:MAG: tetratricopeptide repeat protein [bacterium]
MNRSSPMRAYAYNRLRLFVMLILFLLLNNNVFSDEALIQAERFASKGDYYSAITEYKRYMFFNPECKGNAYYNIGMLYRKMHEWQKAIDNLEASILYEKDKNTAEERRIKLATTLIASQNYNLARLELIKVYEHSESPINRSRALYFDGIASTYAYDWNSAIESFRKFYSEDNLSRIEKIDSVLKNARNSYKSKRLAQIFSVIVPGAGQIYAGDLRNGLNAFVLNGILIFLTANTINNRDYKDALLISTVLLYRYYTGNIYYASKAVEKYNNVINHRAGKEILQIVSKDEPLSGGN